MSPDDLANAQKRIDDNASKTRLRKYFFEDLWDEMPEVSREALLAADQEFMATEGRREGIYNSLRLAVEPILEARLVVPFKKWTAEQGRQYHATDRSKGLTLTNQIKELWELNQEELRNFVKSCYPEVPRAQLNEIFQALDSLRGSRNRSEHPAPGHRRRPDDVARQYNRLVGINQKGVISQLMEFGA